MLKFCIYEDIKNENFGYVVIQLAYNNDVNGLVNGFINDWEVDFPKCQWCQQKIEINYPEK